MRYEKYFGSDSDGEPGWGPICISNKKYLHTFHKKSMEEYFCSNYAHKVSIIPHLVVLAGDDKCGV